MDSRRPTLVERQRRLAAYEKALLIRDIAYAASQAAGRNFEAAIAATLRDELAVAAALAVIRTTRTALQDAEFALGRPTKAMRQQCNRDVKGRIEHAS